MEFMSLETIDHT